MAKQVKEYLRGVATFSGYVDQLRHVGDNDYGRSGDWIDVAVHGGVISIPAIEPVEIDDQVLVRGTLRNRGRVLDFNTQTIVVCKSEEQIESWEKALQGHYRLNAILTLNSYDRPTMVNKVLVKFNGLFQGMGIQFQIPLEEEQFLRLKSFERLELDYQFDLIRDFRVTGGEGNRQQIDTWRLTNPLPLTRKSRPVPNAEVAGK